MRVYEFAKQNNVSSKEVLALLKDEGIDLASHMSVLPDEAIDILTKTVAREKVSAEPVVEKKAPEVMPVKAEVPVTKKQPVKEEPVVAPKPIEKVVTPVAAKIEEIKVAGEMPLWEAAQLMKRSEGELILALLKRGSVCNRNHILTVKIISELAHQMGMKVVTTERPRESWIDQRLAVEKSHEGGRMSRWPIVVVMGHVDHGKTSLLDYIRKMNTAAKEKGGITQHLSAYEVDSKHGKIVFLDTPGHEAFSYMRKRGASITDILILVIAADDGIKPQTIEVINHAKTAGVPIIVAINKIDKVDRASATERVKRQLAQHDLLPEDWGGSVICVPLSAKTGEGVDDLLEMVVLQSQMMDLKANPEDPARGFILESEQEKGFGPVATVICVNGTIHVGDYFVCGSSTGRVRLLVNSAGERITSAGPSIPVQVVGFDNFASLGDWMTVVSQDEYTKEKTSRKKESGSENVSGELLRKGESEEERLLLLIKTDTHGSREAVTGEIKKLNKAHPDIPCTYQIIYSGIGNVSEKDVELAAHAGADLIALHVKIEKTASVMAKEQGLEIKEYDIIYRLTEALDEELRSHEEEIVTLKKVGQATVRKVFDLGKRGVIAGCYMNEGVVARGNIVVCMRKNQKIGQAKIVSLQRERKNVKEVHAGFECGFITDSFQEWQENDNVEIYVEEKKKRSEM